MNHDDNDPIAPAPVTLNVNPKAGAAGTARDAPANKPGPRIWLGLGAAMVLLLAVIFVLPSYVAERPRPGVAGAGAANNIDTKTESAAAAAGPQESPWTDAQFAKQRRQAQEVLAKLLDRQETLEGMQVSRWAADAYEAAKASAAAADSLYRQQQFNAAHEQYNAALAQFNELIKQSEQVLSDSVAAGLAALEAGESQTAKAQFQVALNIDPAHTGAREGLERAGVLDDVLTKIKAGKQLERNNQLDAAKAEYVAALKLDGQSALARERVDAINHAIKERDFAKQMSIGFAAMNGNQYDDAIAAFQSALSIKPNAADAREALTQAQNQETQSAIQNLLAQARQQEQAADWHDAVKSYEQALKLDDALVEARVGLIRSRTRADIHDKLAGILDQPGRLTAPAVHREFQQFYRETRAIKDPDPALNRQLDQLAVELERAVAPVTVQFKSDNQTKVTLYKVGELGSFTAKELTLKPGRYTAVGSRDGYRDVRREFTVSAGQSETVTIQCEEKISTG